MATNSDRQAFVEGLRALADLIENCAVPLPVPITCHAFGDRAEVERAARLIAPCVKQAFDTWAWVERSFGPFVKYEMNTARANVCTRRVVGTRAVPERVIPAHDEEVVEWDCEPFLSKSAE